MLRLTSYGLWPRHTYCPYPGPAKGPGMLVNASKRVVIGYSISKRYLHNSRTDLRLASFTDTVRSFCTCIATMDSSLSSSRAHHRALTKLSILASICSFGVLMLWIIIGNFLYKNSAEMLPFSADECFESNFTSLNITGVREYISPTNSTVENSSTNTSFIVSLYQISSSLYIFFGSLICVLLAVSVSYLTGNEKIEKISPKLISPSIRKFYWTKEELANFQDNETKDDNYE
ncbi:Sodium-coupled monocarboxylate transporter 2 [Armadillidium vulgare]|nr:Sodium-coupled monocarboxylate transporter 2 [Armadillidium vulgare]